MKNASITALPVMALLTTLAAIPPARADGTVNVVLQDATDGGDVTGMKMIATPDSVKAGQITIHATNESKGLVHEVVVILAPKDGAPLPYDSKTAAVVEKRVKDIGEVPDLAPGKSGTLTLRLAPGNYLLICNQPSHYKAGMWTRLTVTS